MNQICCSALCLALVALATANLVMAADETQLKQNVTDEMHLITKSLEDLLGELALIKHEATGRLSKVKNRASTTSEQERIRQTKVSRFVLKRVAELESESVGMRDELAKLFKLNPQQGQKLHPKVSMAAADVRQEDHDFDSQQEQSSPSSTTQSRASSSSQQQGMPAAPTSTMKPDESAEEAAKIGFDIEALKKLGAELEAEIEARQAQTPESIRGVHEQVIKLVDNMVQNYLGNVRRTIQRMTNFIDNRRGANRPRESPKADLSQEEEAASSRIVSNEFAQTRQSILNQVQHLAERLNEFTTQWSSLTGRQQSPLIDRIPPRGVELWRDFWDTVRKQVRRINQEFWQLSQDMTRMLTGLRVPAGTGTRLPPSRNIVSVTPQTITTSNAIVENSLLYSAAADSSELITKQFQEFYDKMSVTLGEEQQKLDTLTRMAQSQSPASVADSSNLIDEQDDQTTKDELSRNVALRQQIQQEINVFGSIFDIMRAFIQRLRESASNIVRDVMPGGQGNNVDNNPVTPGPSVKPQVDKLLEETIGSQRLINSNAKPVLLPNNRPINSN